MIRTKALPMIVGLLAGTVIGFSQDIPALKVGGETIQIHAFASQGYIDSGNNNFLTMDSTSGSFDMTDFGVNVSSQLTDKLHVGAQMYDYNVGHLGQWHPTFDWGYVDYKFKDWFGIRAGKVKTVLGLYNDTQDAAFLYTWALMPQSMYPLDLRANSIAHEGADLYGHISLMKKAGSVDYTAYYGYVPWDPYGGYAYSITAAGAGLIQNEAHRTGGEDVRWNTPITGLTVGNSFAYGDLTGYGKLYPYPDPDLNIAERGMTTVSTYADYVRGKWHFAGEFRDTYDLINSYLNGLSNNLDMSNNSLFVSGAYRFGKRLEVGAYNSRLYIDHSSTPSNPDSTHIFDQAITARVDLTNFWNVKVEGHFMNGYGDIYSAHGFYPYNNPSGLKPDTNMIVIRTGVNF